LGSLDVSSGAVISATIGVSGLVNGTVTDAVDVSSRDVESTTLNFLVFGIETTGCTSGRVVWESKRRLRQGESNGEERGDSDSREQHDCFVEEVFLFR